MLPMNVMMKKISFLFMLLIFGFSSCQKQQTSQDNLPFAKDSLKRKSTTLPSLAKGGDFTLPATDGTSFTLSKSNNWVLLYFGYTMCPDACPMTMTKIGQVEKLLKKENRAEIIDKLLTVFVTVDPDRDNLEKLGAYLSYFPVRSLGLVGTKEQVATIADVYNVEYKYVDTGSAGGYAVDHTTSVFLIDPQGKLRYVFSYKDKSKKIAALLMTLIK